MQWRTQGEIPHPLPRRKRKNGERRKKNRKGRKKNGKGKKDEENEEKRRT